MGLRVNRFLSGIISIFHFEASIHLVSTLSSQLKFLALMDQWRQYLELYQFHSWHYFFQNRRLNCLEHSYLSHQFQKSILNFIKWNRLTLAWVRLAYEYYIFNNEDSILSSKLCSRFNNRRIAWVLFLDRSQKKFAVVIWFDYSSILVNQCKIKRETSSALYIGHI